MMSSTMWRVTIPMFALLLSSLPHETMARSESKCPRIKFDPCQREALSSNREFVARYTKESVESFSVDLFQPPILKPTRQQTREIKQRYRNMFTYPDKVNTTVVTTVVTESSPEPTTISTTEATSYGTTVDRNNTCTNTTEREVYQDSGWIRITETIQCNQTDVFGRFTRTNKRSSRYEPLDRERLVRGRRQVNGKMKLCEPTKDFIPNEQVLYTVTGKGDTVQLVQMNGAYQDQGDNGCTAADNIPSGIVIQCDLEMMESPKVVFKLRGRNGEEGRVIESANIRLPRCRAYMVVP